MQRFMFLGIGILCLMVSALIGFHLGSEVARAQDPADAVVSFGNLQQYLMMPNGDVYYNEPDGFPGAYQNPAVYVGNFFSGTAPVSASPESISEVKSKYK